MNTDEYTQAVMDQFQHDTEILKMKIEEAISGTNVSAGLSAVASALCMILSQAKDIDMDLMFADMKAYVEKTRKELENDPRINSSTAATSAVNESDSISQGVDSLP